MKALVLKGMKLPEKHLARYVGDAVSKLDLHELKIPYTGVSSEAFHAEMLLALLFYGYATELEQQLKEEMARLMAMAEAAGVEAPEGMDMPVELVQRKERWKAIGEAKAQLEAQAVLEPPKRNFARRRGADRRVLRA